MESGKYKVQIDSATEQRNLNNIPLYNTNDEPTIYPIMSSRDNSVPNEEMKLMRNKNESLVLIPDCSTNIIKRNPIDMIKDTSREQNKNEEQEESNGDEKMKPIVSRMKSLKPVFFNKEYGKLHPKEKIISHERIKRAYSKSKEKLNAKSEEIKTIMNDKFISFYSTDDEAMSINQNNSKDLIKDIKNVTSSVFDGIIKLEYSDTMDDIAGDTYARKNLLVYAEGDHGTTHSERGDININKELSGQQYEAYYMSARVNRKTWIKAKHRRGEHIILPTKFKESTTDSKKPTGAPKNNETVETLQKELFIYAPGRGRYMMQQILIMAYVLFILTGLTLAVIFHNLTSSFNTLAGWSMPVFVPLSLILIIFIDYVMESILIMRSIFFGFILSTVAVILNALLYSALGINRQTRIFYIGFIDLSFTMFTVFTLSFYKYRYNRLKIFLDVFLIAFIISSLSIGLDMLLATNQMEAVEKVALYIFTIGYIMFTATEIYLIANDNMLVYKNDFVYAGFIVYNGFLDLTTKSCCFLFSNFLLQKRK